jgi:ABC-2 type transport system ATP-binding protein
VGDVHVFYERWTAEKNLRFLSRFYPNWSEKRAAELAGRFRLPLDKKVKDLSTGDRVKLSLTRALAYSPRLLLLDEPTSGLDPVVRSELLDELFEFQHKGESAIFYSTHILSDIKRLVDRLVFLDQGRVFLSSGKEDLAEKWRKISFTLPGEDIAFEAAASHNREGNHHQIVSFDFNTTVSQLRHLGAENISENRIAIDEIAVYIMKGGKNVATS